MRQVSEPVEGCQLYVPAWSSTGLACSVMFLSCYAHGFAGSAADTSAVLSKLDPTVLQVLVISHCYALEMPPIVTKFSRLVGMEVFNATLLAWPSTAAIQEATQPLIGYVYLTKTNFSDFPTGLLHRDLPRALTAFLIVQGNVSSIPETLGELWASRPWSLLVFEELQSLRQVPDSLCLLTSKLWGFGWSTIDAFPENCFAGAQYITMSGCPLQELPNTVAFDPLDLLILSAEHTNISVLPPWLKDTVTAPTARVDLFGSAVCSNASLLEPLEEFTRWSDSCSIDMHTYEAGYPWELMLPQRQLVP